MVALSFALVYASGTDETRTILLKGGDQLRVVVSHHGTDRCQLLRISRGEVVQRAKVPVPKNCHLMTDNSAVRPIAILTGRSRSSLPILCLTLQEESGVYGYRKVLVLRVDCSGPRMLEPLSLGSFEFSDFGSWTLASKTLIMTWDADLSTGPHHGRHLYIFRWLSIRKGLPIKQTLHSKWTYNPDWQSDGNRPLIIQKGNDPLRELGMQWRWWGQMIHKNVVKGIRRPQTLALVGHHDQGIINGDI